MINPLQRTNVETVEDDLAFQFVPVLLDMVVLHHNNHHVYIIKELIKVAKLILCNLLIFQERIVTLQWTGKVTFLQFQHLESGRFAIVIHILLVSKTIEADLTVVGNVVLLHDFIDAIKHELGLAIVGLHGLVNHLCQTGIVAHQEPRVNGDAVTAYTGTRL